MLKPAWYVLLYHEVSWEEPPHLRSIGGMVVPPDRFREHLEVLDAHGRLLGVDEALSRLADGGSEPREPWFSIWFDDGYAGVRRYAAPILARRRLQAALSVCSRFAMRQEMYWRAELGWLAGGDGLRFVRSRLRRLGVDPGSSVRDVVMDRFSPDLRDAIGSVYEKITPELVRQDAFRLFDTAEGLRRLGEAGFRLANHSAAHWPVGESTAIEAFGDQFRECAEACRSAGISLSDDWVLPFDRRRDPRLDETFEAACPSGRLVLVGNRPNTAADVRRRRIHRIVAPPVSGKALLDRLRACPPAL